MFDLGGGTYDVSLLEVGAGTVEVLSTGGWGVGVCVGGGGGGGGRCTCVRNGQQNKRACVWGGGVAREAAFQISGGRPSGI